MLGRANGLNGPGNPSRSRSPYRRITSLAGSPLPCAAKRVPPVSSGEPIPSGKHPEQDRRAGSRDNPLERDTEAFEAFILARRAERLAMVEIRPGAGLGRQSDASQGRDPSRFQITNQIFDWAIIILGALLLGRVVFYVVGALSGHYH